MNWRALMTAPAEATGSRPGPTPRTLYAESAQYAEPGPAGSSADSASSALEETAAGPAAVVEIPTEPTDTEARRRWIIHTTDGQVFDTTYCPPATLSEVRTWYPGASIEAEQDASLEPAEPPVKVTPAEAGEAPT